VSHPVLCTFGVSPVPLFPQESRILHSNQLVNEGKTKITQQQ
jgi:hypothetical protein